MKQVGNYIPTVLGKFEEFHFYCPCSDSVARWVVFSRVHLWVWVLFITITVELFKILS